AVAQETPAPLEQAMQLANAERELAGCLVACLAFPVAKEQRGAIALRQLLQLRVQNGLHFLPVAHGICRRVLGNCTLFAHLPLALALLAFPAACSLSGEIGGDPAGDAVQPAAERRALADGAGLAREHQERRLAGVLGI